jgi:hypothetical protein
MKKLDLEIDGERYSFLLKTKMLRKRNRHSNLSLALLGIDDYERRGGDLEATTYKGYEMKKDAVKGTFSEVLLDSINDDFSHTFELQINYVGKTKIYITENSNGFRCGIIERNGHADMIKEFSMTG